MVAVIVVVRDSPQLASHLGHAIASHLRWCRLNGVSAPDELTHLLEALSHDDDPTRLEATRLAFDAALVDHRLMGIPDAACTLGVSRRTVERMVADGRLSSVRIGRRVMVPASAIDEYGRPVAS